MRMHGPLRLSLPAHCEEDAYPSASLMSGRRRQPGMQPGMGVCVVLVSHLGGLAYLCAGLPEEGVGVHLLECGRDDSTALWVRSGCQPQVMVGGVQGWFASRMAVGWHPREGRHSPPKRPGAPSWPSCSSRSDGARQAGYGQVGYAGSGAHVHANQTGRRAGGTWAPGWRVVSGVEGE